MKFFHNKEILQRVFPLGSHSSFCHKNTASLIRMCASSIIPNPSSSLPTSTMTSAIMMDSTNIIEIDDNRRIDSGTICKHPSKIKTTNMMNETQLSKKTSPNAKVSIPKKKKMLKTFPIEISELDSKRIFEFSKEPESDIMIKDMPNDQLIHVSVKSLRLFCKQQHIPRNSSTTKNQLIDVIIHWRSSQTSNLPQHISETQSKSMDSPDSQTSIRSHPPSKFYFILA